MSKSNKPTKVLRVASKRLENGWTKWSWADHDTQTGVTKVCLEGAIFGFKNEKGVINPACFMARDLVLQIIKEKYQDEHGFPKYHSIPHFNDSPEVTHEMVLEVTKLALIRAESGGLIRETEAECYEPVKKLWL